MSTFTVAVEIRKMYHIEVLADTAGQAARIAEDYSSLSIEEDGTLENIETAVIETTKQENCD